MAGAAVSRTITLVTEEIYQSEIDQLWKDYRGAIERFRNRPAWYVKNMLRKWVFNQTDSFPNLSELPEEELKEKIYARH